MFIIKKIVQIWFKIRLQRDQHIPGNTGFNHDTQNSEFSNQAKHLFQYSKQRKNKLSCDIFDHENMNYPTALARAKRQHVYGPNVGVYGTLPSKIVSLCQIIKVRTILHVQSSNKLNQNGNFVKRQS